MCSSDLVSLEPCSHHGVTAPCADAIVNAGLKRVVSAIEDPDQRVAGRGHAKIVEAGIALRTAIGAREEDMLAMERRGMGQSVLADILSIPEALITPREAEQDYRREHEEITASAVFFVGSNYLSKVTVTPEALGRFFTNRMSTYQVPEKFVLSYVRFPGSNHLAAAEAEQIGRAHV